MSGIKSKLKNLNLKVVVTWAAVTLGVMAFFVLVGAAVVMSYSSIYEGKCFPGVRVLNVRLDGLTTDEAQRAVQDRIDAVLANGLPFRFRGTDANVDVILSAPDGSVSREFIQYDIDAAIRRACSLGRDAGPVKNALLLLRARINPIRIPAEVTIDEKGISESLEQAFKEHLADAKDARFDIRLATGTTPLIHIENEQRGVGFRAEDAMRELRRQAESLAFRTIELAEERREPKMTRALLEPLQNGVVEFLDRPPFTFTVQDRRFPITQTTLAALVTVLMRDGVPTIGFSRDAFLTTMKQLAPDLEQAATNGSLDVQDGKIVSFTPGTQGSSIDVEQTLAAVEASWPKETVFPLIVSITPGALLGEDPEALGIKEIVGVGRSNFSGSPVNRRKNIAKGAQKVNGSLIPPGGEFSLLTTLGSIDGVNGWLPELVIKGNETKPEFGGGLCQIGTTTFRAALASGLKITERRNHSYRVRYYEPAGTDATIYEPSPDFKFVNDTGHHILIHAYIKGDDAIFEFWGTKDGRTTLFKGSKDVTRVEDLKPRVYNVAAPPPMKLVETLDLPPGKKKCTEVAHAGADTDFTYQVTYADGSTKEEVFASHYRPWQAVCLIGVEKLSEPPDTTTNEVVN